jgi:hypothetical protein
MLRYTSEQRIFMYDSYVKYGSAGKCRRKFRRKFHDEIVPSGLTIPNLVNKLKTAGLLIGKKQKHKLQMLNEEKLDDAGARLEHTRRKSLKLLAQETAVSKSNARTATQLLKSPSESWCLMCCKCKKECCTCVFSERINYKKYRRVERTFSTPPVICEL